MSPFRFRMFKARGQPGCWYGYAEIDGVTYKIDAKHVGKGVAKHFEGTIKRHLKSDQRDLPGFEGRLPSAVPDTLSNIQRARAPLINTGFDDDELPEDL